MGARRGKAQEEKMILPLDFYQSTDVIALARQLLGKWLFSHIDGQLTGGMIIETEAYKGAEDRASHAYNNRRTPRTEIMFASGGHSYVYLCYGIHNLFNVVTGPKDTPHAVLIRALAPDCGLDIMQKRRKKLTDLTSGPGALCQALGINRGHTGSLLNAAPIWIEDRGFTPSNVLRTERIGIDYAGADAKLPYRFLLELNK